MNQKTLAELEAENGLGAASTKEATSFDEQFMPRVGQLPAAPEEPAPVVAEEPAKPKIDIPVRQKPAQAVSIPEEARVPAEAAQVAVDDAVEVDATETPKTGMASKLYMGFAAVGLVVVAGIAYAIFGGSSAPVATQAPVEAAAPVAGTAPGVASAPNPAPGVPGDMGMISTGTVGAAPAAPEVTVLALEQALELQALPPADRTCTSPALSEGFDRELCKSVGVQKYFQCTANAGRRWDVRIPGCENG